MPTVKDALILWGEEIVTELRAEIDKVINVKGGGVSSLSDSVRSEVVDVEGGHTIQIWMADYYKYVESGRKPNSKAPPTGPIEKWIEQRYIDPRKIILDIQVRHRGISLRRKGLKNKLKTPEVKTLKALSFAMARKRLSWMFAKSIGKKGIEARPFISKVLTTERLKELNDILSKQFAKDFIVDFKRT